MEKQFKKNDKVMFAVPGGRLLFAVVTRVNKKTVRVIEGKNSDEPGREWKVLPAQLAPAMQIR